MAGIANFLDVVSNLGFLIVGIAGLTIVFGGVRNSRVQERAVALRRLSRRPLTALDRAITTWRRTKSLFWDRLPLTIAFMGLVASQIVDRIDIRAGLALLVPILLVGARVGHLLANHGTCRCRQH